MSGQLFCQHYDFNLNFRGTLLGANGTKEDYAAVDEHRKHHLDILRQLRNEHPDLSLEQLEKIATAKIVADAPKSRAFYRIQVKKFIDQCAFGAI